MLQLVVMLFAHPGQAEALARYEAQALPLLARHGGALVSAFEPDAGPAPRPDLIHAITFPSQAHFDAYRGDPDRAALQPLRDAVIARAVVYSGAAAPDDLT